MQREHRKVLSYTFSFGELQTEKTTAHLLELNTK